jgi:hypothetical protein
MSGVGAFAIINVEADAPASAAAELLEAIAAVRGALAAYGIPEGTVGTIVITL